MWEDKCGFLGSVEKKPGGEGTRQFESARLNRYTRNKPQRAPGATLVSVLANPCGSDHSVDIWLPKSSVQAPAA